jgi:hypothetical protein
MEGSMNTSRFGARLRKLEDATAATQPPPTREIWIRVVSRQDMEEIAELPHPELFEELMDRRFRGAAPNDDSAVVQVKCVKVADVLAEFRGRRVPIESDSNPGI